MQPPPPQPRDPDRLPDSSDPSGPCPRCGRPSNFTPQGSAHVAYRYGSWAMGPDGRRERVPYPQLTVLQCGYCTQNTLVIEEELIGGVRHGNGGTVAWRGIHWWPTLGGSGTFGPAVPAPVTDAFSEGVRWLPANAPNGAAALFRNAPSVLVEDRDPTLKGDLRGRVTKLIASGGLPQALGDWADHVRPTENAGVHPEKFGAVDIDEAQDLANLTHDLIHNAYVIPVQIAARQAARSSQPKP
jgi:hypothetical protein